MKRPISTLPFLLILFCSFYLSLLKGYGQGEGSLLDSMKAIVPENDSVKIAIYKNIVREHNARIEYDSARHYLSLILNEQKGPEDVIFYHYHLATSYFADKPDTARFLYQKTYKLAKEHQIVSYQCYTLLSLGALNNMLGNDSLAIEIYKEALHVSDSLIKADFNPDKFKRFQNKCRLNLAAIYMEKGEYGTSSSYVLDNIDEVRALGDNDLLVRFIILAINANIAWMDETTGEIQKDLLEETKSLLKEGREVADKVQNDRITSYLLSANYNLLYDQGEYDSALVYIRAAFELNRKVNDTENMIIRASRIARCFAHLNQRDSAFYYSDLSIEIAEQSEMLDNYYDARISKVEVLITLDLNKQAIDFTQDLIAINEKLTNPQKKRLYQLYKAVLIQEKKYRKAMFADSLLQVTLDSMQITQQFETIEDLKAKYESEKKEARISLLELKEKESQQQLRIQRLVILLTIVGVISLVIVGLLLVRTNRLRQKEKELSLNHKILRTQIDPHFFFNILQSFQTQLIKFKSDKILIQQLSTFAKLMRKILNYSTEEEVSLSDELEMLEEYIQTHQIRQSIQLDYKLDIHEGLALDNFGVPPLITQPLVENSIKHGFKGLEKGLITIRVRQVNQDLSIEIEDNGHGIDLSTLKFGSKGLTIINERIQLLNSSGTNANLSFANVDSTQQQKGTIVKIEFKNVI